MNDTTTSDALVTAARELFARDGFDGTSVRAITRRAGANLGAITYHFGSKRALYEAAFASVAEPFRERFTRAASGAGTPLERIERVVRAVFDFFAECPDFPRLVLQQIASTRPLPEAAVRTLRANVTLLAGLIVEGQRDGSIRSGDALLMALSIGSQPIWLTLARRALHEGVEIDQDDHETRALLVESVVRFVRAGLAAHREAA